MPVTSPSRRSFARGALAFPVAVASFALGPGIAHAQVALEGKTFDRLRNPQPVTTGKKIEVIEFFSYGCPHCADLDPELQMWMRKLPADVQFLRVPVMFQERWIALAKIYYTLDALGEEAKYTPEVFAAIHRNNVNLASDKTFFEWAAGKGLDRKKVEDMYNSFGLTGRVNRAKSMAQVYNVQSVPTLIVDGKYVTDSGRTGSHAAIPGVLDALIVKARTERPKS